jgi:glyceraldehyde-3-phosphate dehydrogenase/erythrose-4-phosphate dehydrogenase
MVKVAINGFGRIGRLAFRQMLQLLAMTLLLSTTLQAPRCLLSF